MGEEGAGWLGIRGQVREVTQSSPYANHYPGTVLKGVRHLTWHLPMSPPPPTPVGPFLALLLGLGL